MMLRPCAPVPPLRPRQNSDADFVVICGDIHLRPSEGGVFHSFLDDLALTPPQHLVILGDLFDYWLDSAAFVSTYGDLFARVGRLVAVGCTVHLVLGNRELVAGPRLAAAAPWTVSLRRLDVWAGDRVLRIVHGDRLVRDPGYRLLAATLRSWWFRSWQACAPLTLHRWVARLLRGHSQRKGRRVADIGPPLRILDPRRVAAAGRQADVLLAGHIHQRWQHWIRGIEFHLCGHWDDDRGRYVVIDAAGRVRHRDYP